MKLLDILKEGTLTLTPEERQQVEAMIPDIINNIKKPLPPNDKVYDIGNIKYEFADGEEGEVKIVVGYPGSDNAKGVFITHDPKNRTDNWIIINPTQFQKYFLSDDFGQNIRQSLSGTANTGIERLRQVLKHELIHAKDPALNHHYLKEPYSITDPSVYYKSWAEFQTMTGQFFESLISGTDRVLSNFSGPDDIKRIESALANILQFFAGKTKIISLKTAEFIDGTGSRNIFQRLFNFVDSALTGKIPKSTDFALNEYIIYINLIKQYNPEGYKEFLKDLYKTIKSIEEKINDVSPTKIKVQEMKSNLNEIKRMQQLAGLLNEVENPEQELKDILKADYPTFVQKLGDNINDPKFQNAIKSIANKYPIKTTDLSPKVKDLKPTQNEIDLDKSLGFPLKDANVASSYLKGGLTSPAGKSIITGGGGKFIIDGHHRWSQVYCINPESSIKAMDVSNITDPVAGLKATQLGIAGDIGKVPVQTVKGQNLLVMGKDALVAYVTKTVTPEVIEAFKKAGKATDANSVAEYIWKNVELMQQNNTPLAPKAPRGIMPQTDDAANWNQDAPNPQAVKEISRMQQLAGIISLNEEEAAADNAEIDQAMKAGLSALKDTSALDEIKDEDQPQQLNEEPITLIASALLAAPKILSWIGKIVGYISSPFTGENENSVSKKITHFAHKWEGYYIKGIAFVIKFTKFGKQLWLSPDNKVDEQKLIALSKIIYGVILAIAMGNAIGTVLGPASPALKAIEGALGSVKAVEIAQIASKVKGQI